MMVKACQVCGQPRPKGRVKFCSDDCAKANLTALTRAKDDKRLIACWRCRGPKEPGVQGGKYCNECRRIIADSSQQAEYERGRRRHVADVARRLAAGERIKSRSLDVPEGTKWCSRCQDFRPLTSFATNGTRKSGVVSYCKPCQRSYNRERRLMLHYGLTYDEYEMLLACQDFRCAICKGKPRSHSLSVDHDHKTGEIRGLLCSRCNHKLLGSANDDPIRLREAADYLEAFMPREVFGMAKLLPGFSA